MSTCTALKKLSPQDDVMITRQRIMRRRMMMIMRQMIMRIIVTNYCH